MAQPQWRPEVIEEVEPPAPEKPPRELALLLLSLKALSQRAIAAISDLFFLLTVASCFWLWYLTPEPNAYQIVSLSLYALFVLAANWLVRRK